MKFIHAADIHLDSPMSGAARREGAPAEALRGCTRRAFRALIDLAVEEDAAFLVIPGDLYDGAWRDYGTGLFFAGEMERWGRPCFVTLGNHDAESIITRGLRASRPPNVHLFPANRCETVRLPGLGLALHGRSFAERASQEDLSASYGPAVPGLLNVGLLHTSADGREGHDPYAPCTVEGLRAHGYGYWALGHVHAREVLSREPWIVFSGNLQGRSVRETGARGCTVVHVEDGQVVAAEPRAVDVLRWAAVDVDLTGADAPAEAWGRVREALEGAVAAAEGRRVAARITLRGTTPLHARLLADPDWTAYECDGVAQALGDALWVETLKLRTAAPRGHDGEALLAELLGAAGDDDEALEAALRRDLQALLNRFPAGAADEEVLGLAEPASLRHLLREARTLLAHSLSEA